MRRKGKDREGASRKEGAKGLEASTTDEVFFFLFTTGDKTKPNKFCTNRAGLCLYRVSVPGSLGRAM